MDLEEIENKYQQYLQVWILYVEISIELKKKSELSKESAVNACKVYGPYITDILRQVEEVIKLFSMEKELRKIRNRGDFPVPKFTPDSIKIETTRDKGHKNEQGKLQKRTRGSKEQRSTVNVDKTKTSQQVRLQFLHNSQQHTHQK